jgi:hypothetical protein
MVAVAAEAAKKARLFMFPPSVLVIPANAGIQ